MVSATHLIGERVRVDLLLWGVAALVVGLTAVWALTTTATSDPAVHHDGPVSVTAIDGTDLARISITAEAADRIGLEVAPVRAAGRSGRTTVPGDALVVGADGTTWVYVVDGDPLQYVRRVVQVVEIRGSSAVLSDGPVVGTRVVGLGSAELFGAETGVGH